MGATLNAVHGLLLAVASLAGEHGLSSVGFSTAQALEHRLRSCDAQVASQQVRRSWIRD